MALVDECTIKVISGTGGNGCISFRREKYIPKGGPDGGNGGDGGSVFLRATHNKGSLLDFKYQPKYQADRGQHGMGSDMNGKCGEDLILDVPVGTLVFNTETNECLADLATDEDILCVAVGGRGGRGNLSFKSSTNRAPRVATPGQAGQTFELKLELRLMADIGLVGLPNAGKSSFLRVVSRARPKVADYPFTTLEPHLGVVDHKDVAFVVADLPGLIEGASEGAGLGHKFLRHVSRNRLLLHLIDVSQTADEIENSLQVIHRELEAFDPDLLGRETLLIFTKADLLPTDQLDEKRAELAARGLNGHFISSHSGYGVSELLDFLAEKTAQEHRRVANEDSSQRESTPDSQSQMESHV